MVKTVKSLTDFKEDLTNAGSILVVVYFHAEWNRDSHAIIHVIKELESVYSDVLFLSADVDEAEDLVGTYEIYEMPTFKFFRNGTLINELTGADEALLKHLVDTLR
ncbi:hypothetical protein CHS0354_010770 [Potamilus streckersoni]|uniref:Thioredoxin domain-containing protein n=1 Tax=Potamilus streckersoni TaxID=2493646 RepID=A0AAE0T9B0_9BIVA|nr:hypothetical protein CHS0354_010770 [Potamilus streckersoni]